MRRAQSARQVWALPALLGLASAVGLVAGLVSEGVGDWVAWVALSLPLLAALWGWCRCGE